MNRHSFKNSRQAFTLIELIVIVTTLLVIVCLIPVLCRNRQKVATKNCANNLKQIGLAFKTWNFDGDQFTMGIPTNAGGSKEWIESGSAFPHFWTMTNEMKTPKVLCCPRDSAKIPAKSFRSDFSDTNVSYFVGTDAQDTYPQMLLSGDRNLALSGNAVNPGLFVLTTNETRLSWTKAIHDSCGNIGFADGSVQLLDSKKLRTAAQDQGMETNRLAVP